MISDYIFIVVIRLLKFINKGFVWVYVVGIKICKC